MREEKPSKPAPGKSKKPGADRLAEALRDNLKRRKAQSRAKVSEPATTEQGRPQKEPD